MGQRSITAATPGVSPLPVPVLPLPDASLDPVEVLRALLRAGQGPAQIVPARSAGFQELLQATHHSIAQSARRRWEAVPHAKRMALAAAPIDQPEKRPQVQRRLQEIHRRQLTGQADAPLSAICVHRDLAGWIAAAQVVLANPETWLRAGMAAVVCADEAERQRIEALLRQPVQDSGGDGEPVPCDPIAAAQRTAVEFYGADPAGLPDPLLLAGGIEPADSYSEVFISLGCWQLPGQELLRALGAVKVGVHVLAGSP